MRELIAFFFSSTKCILWVGEGRRKWFRWFLIKKTCQFFSICSSRWWRE